MKGWELNSHPFIRNIFRIAFYATKLGFCDIIDLIPASSSLLIPTILHITYFINSGTILVICRKIIICFCVLTILLKNYLPHKHTCSKHKNFQVIVGLYYTEGA